MAGAGFRRSSLRGKLSAAAFAGLLTTGTLTALLLLTAHSANDVIETVRQSQDRVRVYGQLQMAARVYQAASFASVREPGARTRRSLGEARAQLESVLKRAQQLPAVDQRSLEAKRRIARQGRALITRFANAGDMVRRVDERWRVGGSPAALDEVNRLSGPIFDLRDTLKDEIDRGDKELAAATSRAKSLTDLAVVGSLVGLLLAFGFSLLVQMLLHLRLRPGLSRLQTSADAFRAGTLDHRIGFAGTDELAQLSNAFDAMARTIAEKQNALQDTQAGLERAVATRTEQLQRANAELSASDERRRAFMADISHELRTPLTVIRGEAQVALRASDGPDFDPHEPLERILEQAGDMNRMVNDLFLIARAESGGLPLQRETIALGDVAGRVVSDFETLVVERAGTIRIIHAAHVVAFVDRCRLRRALAALIENALQHCERGVNIEVMMAAEDEFAVISVSDDGPGVDFAKADQLFQRFRRGRTLADGSGLGLSLVRALVAAHGGTTELAPRRGGGTCVTMRFPAAASQEAAA